MVDPVTCPVVLVRALRGCGEAGRVVHVVALSDGTGPPGLLGARCGISLVGNEVETVEPGVGMPCPGCLLYRDVMSLSPSVSSYRQWGWPVRGSADQVLLDLDGEYTAVVMPARLAQAVSAILTGRDRCAPVLVNPSAPLERTLVAGEPYGVPLPWPGGVRLVTGALALPPSATPCGSLRWEQLPPDPSLAGCREIDIFSAVHTTLHAAADAEGGYDQ
ncbi:MAG: hypothetical protein ACT4NP_18575 [Pseudonocardiales bacterium]